MRTRHGVCWKNFLGLNKGLDATGILILPNAKKKIHLGLKKSLTTKDYVLFTLNLRSPQLPRKHRQKGCIQRDVALQKFLKNKNYK